MIILVVMLVALEFYDARKKGDESGKSAGTSLVEMGYGSSKAAATGTNGNVRTDIALNATNNVGYLSDDDNQLVSTSTRPVADAKNIGPVKTDKKTTTNVSTNSGPRLVESIDLGDRQMTDNKNSNSFNDGFGRPPTLPEKEVIVPSVKLSENIAPYGRLLRCELVNTLESSNLGTPIIGLVTRPLAWPEGSGKILIPSNVEVHGISQSGKMRDRITGTESWVLVFPQDSTGVKGGGELLVKGMALTRSNFDGRDKESWDIRDGSLGIKGRVIDERDKYKIELWLASFIANLAPNMQQTQQQGQSILNPTGVTVPVPNVKDALLGGVKGAMDSEVERVKQAIQDAGYYCRVPAGTQFYLYVEQTIDLQNASLGETAKARVREAAIAEAQRTGAKVKLSNEEVLNATKTPSQKKEDVTQDILAEMQRQRALDEEKKRLEIENQSILLQYQKQSIQTSTNSTK